MNGEAPNNTDALNIFSFQNALKTNNNQEDENLSPSPYADTYKMDHPKRGLAIIFNHVNFNLTECPKRDGSDKDRDDLERIFHFLDFDVLIHNDLSAYEISQVLYRVSQMNHTDSDCLAVVVMSHGDNAKLYAKDRHYRTDTLWKFFSADKCPTLAGKPKLFFIQACRGQGLHPGQTLTYKTSEDSDDSSYAYYTVPVMADILVMYSTMQGYYSWRDPKEGGYFIQSLVRRLKGDYETKDLLTILTFVNRDVAVNFTSYEPNVRLSGQKQMCSIVSMLTRLVYFSQKKNSH